MIKLAGTVLLVVFFLSACYPVVSQKKFNLTATARYEILLLPTITPTPTILPPIPAMAPKLSPP